MWTTLNRWIAAASTAALLAAGLTTAAPERPLFVPGEMILKFRSDADESSRLRLLEAHDLRQVRTLLGTRALLLALPQGVDPRELVRDLRKLPQVEYAEPNYYRYIDALPDDPGFPLMYNLDNTGQTGGVADADIDAPEGWDIAVGSRDIVVAVLDSGIDPDHEDLAANLYVNPNETLNGIDDDGNGFVDDVQGWDFVNDDNDPTDPSGGCFSHGTHTSGTLGAVGNNGIGIAGVAHQVQIMPLRTFFASAFFCTANDADLLDAIGYMAMMDVAASNNSWGGGPFSQAQMAGIAAGRHLFVTSAGNLGMNNDSFPQYPASYDLDNIVAVAATNDSDQRWGFSNFGINSVDLGAPGVQVLSTTRGDTYGTLDGTSMAAPHVTGAAVVLLSADPTLTPHELKSRLLRGVDPLGLQVASGGRLNLFNSLTLPPSPVTVSVTPDGPTSISPGDSIDYTVSLTNGSGSAQTVQASVRAWAPDGREFNLVGPVILGLDPGETISGTFSRPTPGTLPAGDYRLIGRAENLTDVFDESVVIYDVN